MISPQDTLWPLEVLDSRHGRDKLISRVFHQCAQIAQVLKSLSFDDTLNVSRCWLYMSHHPAPDRNQFDCDNWESVQTTIESKLLGKHICEVQGKILKMGTQLHLIQIQSHRCLVAVTDLVNLSPPSDILCLSPKWITLR